MTRTIVLERGAGQASDAVFLRDRFHPVAFLLPFLWLGAHRLYGFAALAFLIQGALWSLGRIGGLGLAGTVLPLLFGLAVALEGPRLVAWRLRRKGWREAAVINASDRDEAELLYYASQPPSRDDAAAEDEPALQAPAPSPQPVERVRETLPLFGWRSGRTLLDTGAR